MANVVLIDAGGTNIGSVRYALQRLGVDAPLSSNADEIRTATHVILPGVGAAAPGMQLLFEHSEESDTPCLGLIPASLQLFAKSDALRVPHMGWNSLQIQRASPLLAGIDAGAFAYFVHSYAAPVGDYTLASCDYGGAFSAVVQRGNFYGAQFHPERSAAVGARLLENFIKL